MGAHQFPGEHLAHLVAMVWDRYEAAAFGQKIALFNPYFFFFMEQSPNDFLKRKRRVSKLCGGDSRRHDFDMLPFGMVEPYMQPLATFFPFGQMLHQ